ncbi:hypothetical protein BOSEA31B_15073 [Hyphomicrobiales bacterium]|nr:hypothetical protein BOSEA31B_15073 [Hyphomicrobiales bacterium]CAH1701561.1 hypothetical protein BOSEA1005_21260 [Hyphomicrobiales bacterium]
MIPRYINDWAPRERAQVLLLLHHPRHSRRNWLPHVAGEHRHVKLRHRRRKLEGAKFKMQIGDHQQAHSASKSFELTEGSKLGAELPRLRSGNSREEVDNLARRKEGYAPRVRALELLDRHGQRIDGARSEDVCLQIVAGEQDFRGLQS